MERESGPDTFRTIVTLEQKEKYLICVLIIFFIYKALKKLMIALINQTT